MESEQSGTSTGDGGGGVMLRKPTPSRPQITLPPRNPLDSLVRSSDMTPSPVSLASFLAEHDPDDSVSFSSLLAGAISSPGTQGSGEKSDENEAVSGENHVRNSSPSGSFAERLAARTTSGKASGLPGSPSTGRPSTARFKSMPPSRLPIPSKNCVTIPPGLSPTTLLDSPVLLSTSQQAEPSPTTGTFPLPSFLSRSRGPTGSEPAKEKSSELGNSSSFVFKPFPKPGARNTISPLAGLAPFGLSHQQALAQVQAQAQGQGSSGVPASTIPAAPVAVMSRPTPSSGAMINGSASEVQPFQFRLPPKEEKASEPIAPEQDKQPLVVAPVPGTVERPNTLDRPSDDGYNWRKYGQKLVKGSENPRSYYKCTYANCPMKKKVERSMDGQVTEIVYEGDHNHPKPQPTRRMSVSAGHVSSDGNSRDFRGGMGRPGTSNGSNRATGGDSDLPVYRGNSLVGNGNQEQSSSSVSDDDDKDDDDPEAKRRKKEKLLRDCPPVPRTVREPRVVVQTTSDVDVLDDGYRWRKYGQKVVKGNPHPRSYYKCTNLGCPVRKHVERASNDPKAVITTYEGKHNHDVPAARNSSHDRVNMDAMAAPPVLANEAGVPSTSSSSTNHDHGSRTQTPFTDAVTGRELPKENMLSETKVKIEQQMTKSSVSDGMTFLSSVGMSSMTGATMKDPVRPKEEHMSIMNDSLPLPSAFQGASSGLVLGP